jgi:hypothetical protein
LSNYTKSTNFATKDNLSPGDPLKIVRGTEIDTEFNNISTAISTKTDNSAAAITGGSISGITDLAIADGGTGASTATAALNNLLPSQTGNSSKYLQTDGTNATWDAISINTGDITGTLPVANGGTGITSFGTGIATFLGTPSSANLASAVTDETGSGALVFANTPTLVAPILGTPTSGNFSSGSFTWPTFNQNTTGTAAGLSATLAIASGGTGQTTANAAFNALAPSQTSASGKYLKSDGTNTSWDALDISTADITGTLPVANGGTGVTSSTGTGNVVLSNSPTLVTPILGTPQSGNFSTGTFTWPTFNQNTTGTAAGLSATLATTSGGTGLTSFTSGGVVYASSSSALATGSALTYNGTGLGIGVASATELIDGTAANPRLKFTATSTGYAASQFVNASGASYFARDNSAGSFFGIANGTIVYSSTSDPIGFFLSGTEAMRLTSSSLYTASGINVGFGTSSVSGARLNVTASSNSAAVFQQTSATGYGVTIIPGADTAYQAFVINNAANTLNQIQMFGNGNATFAGNVGIGTSSLSAKLSVVNTGDNSRISIGDTASSTYSTLLMYGGSGKYNFQLGVQTNVNNAFEITPSTATGGTTFSTPALVVYSNGTVSHRSTVSVGDATPSSSGAGITFPATQSASSDANTLDDYEEGTWTPVLAVGFTVVGATTLTGTYTKIGNTVFVRGTLQAATSLTSAGGNTRVTGMPFSSSTSTGVVFAIDDLSYPGTGFFGNTTSGLYNPAYTAGSNIVMFTFSYTV